MNPWWEARRRIPKPRPEWDLEEGSPWEGQTLRPSVWQVARAYPGITIAQILLMMFLGFFCTLLIGWLLSLIIGTITTMTVFAVWAPVSFGLWYLDMYGMIAGWWGLSGDAA